MEGVEAGKKNDQKIEVYPQMLLKQKEIASDFLTYPAMLMKTRCLSDLPCDVDEKKGQRCQVPGSGRKIVESRGEAGLARWWKS